MMNQQKGIILISVLVILLVMTQLLLSLMQGAFLLQKSFSQQKNQHDNFYKLESALYEIVGNDATTFPMHCIIKESDFDKSVEIVHQITGCRVNIFSTNFFYVIADLGIYKCANLESPSPGCVAHHRLYSIYSPSLGKDVLQLRLAQREYHDAEVISWRII